MTEFSNEQEVYFWDMDHTIINNDCDVSWKAFVHAKRIAPDNALVLAEKYYQDYLNNCLDNDEFMSFQLAEFKGKSVDEMHHLSPLHLIQFGLAETKPATITQQLEAPNGCAVYGQEHKRGYQVECEKHDGMHMNIEHLFIEFINDDGSIAKDDEEESES